MYRCEMNIKARVDVHLFPLFYFLVDKRKEMLYNTVDTINTDNTELR